MDRRVFGIETEFGVTCTFQGQRRLNPDEVGRYLFRKVVTWGKSSNVFLENGSRLYLDVGSHPEYATAECDDLLDLVAHDKAGEVVVAGLVADAEEQLAAEGIRGEISLFKNNLDSAGNSYGCHENFLVPRNGRFNELVELLIPFLASRTVYCGAGAIVESAQGPRYSMAQRADHIWEGVSSATTRSRPMINTRDEPHADGERFRRLHVIVGDTNMSQYATYLKVGAMAAMLQMFEADVVFRDLTLANPIRAIRDIAHDPTCTTTVRLANGRDLTAIDLQWEYLERAMRFSRSFGFPPQIERAIGMWEHVLTGLENDPMQLGREVDWVTKLQLLDRHQSRHDLSLGDPRTAMLDLAYHHVHPQKGLFAKLEQKGLVEQLVSPERIQAAVSTAPATTRAHLRSRFVKAAQAKGRDYTVDWVHLKINDRAQRTVVCKDPLAFTDDRVDLLIAEL
jgi:proteasome accessory factor A